MGKIVHLTATGAVPLPADVRAALGIGAGGPVEIEMLDDGEAVIRKPKPDREAEIARLTAEMRATIERFAFLREGRPTDEIMRDIRGDDPFPP